MITSNSCRCQKCKTLLSYEERIKITTYEFIADSKCSGSINRTIDSFNLCKDCFKKYNEYTLNFFN